LLYRANDVIIGAHNHMRSVMNIFATYKDCILQEALKLYPDLPEDISFTVEPPKDSSHGDIATNIAMIASKKVGKSPSEIAVQLVRKLSAYEDVIKAELAGPGFINISLKPSVWHQQLEYILASGINYGQSDLGEGALVNLEFVSCNPTGPMHIGHARGAVFGDCLARILQKVGFKVVKEFYINDAGSQIITLVRSAYIRYLQALGQNASIPEGCYPGEYLIPVAEMLVQKFGTTLQDMPEAEVIAATRDLIVEEMLQLIKADLALLKVHHEVFVSEQKELHDKGALNAAIEDLAAKGFVYEGVLEAPKGKVIEDWEAKPQTIFKSTEFGDDVDRVIVKSNGQHTYFVGDIAYHYNKLSRGFKDMIVVLGADHVGYVKRITAAVNALSEGGADIDVKVTQMVNLLKNGQPYKMSKRAGNFITVKDMVDELGADIIRFIMLTRKGDTVLDLDFALAKEESKDNPVFYVQYAHARAASVLRKAVELGINPEGCAFDVLQSAEEIKLIQKMAQWPRILESSAQMHEPHRITYYLHDLATQFHSLWSLGTENQEMRFVVEGNANLTNARTCLAQAVKHTIASALDVLGVAAMERM